jgi:Ca2+-binding RTX toxin-like protein
MAITHGTAGADTLLGTSAADQLFGEAGNDVLKGLAGADTLDGGKGRDTADYRGSAGVDVELDRGIGFFGDAAGDTYVGVENAVGSSFGDFLVGDGLANRLDGGLGNDNLNGGGGNDVLVGGGGNDQIRGAAGADVINGGGGIDTVFYDLSPLGVNVNLTSGLVNNGDATGDTLTGIENLSGSSGDDILAGNAVANELRGELGDERLFGFAGNDKLVGGIGADTMTGGEGADLFLFGSALESPAGFISRDVILDFRRDQGDKIDLGLIDANAADAVNDGFEFLGKGPTIDAPGQIEYVFENNTTVVRINTDGGNTPEMEIQLLGQIDLVASDFIL